MTVGNRIDVFRHSGIAPTAKGALLAPTEDLGLPFDTVPLRLGVRFYEYAIGAFVDIKRDKLA